MASQFQHFDVVIIGGGPSGATAADDLGKQGKRVLIIDKQTRIKPCGGAIPICVLNEFDIPESLLAAKISSARMVAPSNKTVVMPVTGGFVGMVDRESFDEWLRVRAASHGATRMRAEFVGVMRSETGGLLIRVQEIDRPAQQAETLISCDLLIGADGANSKVAELCIPQRRARKYVYAYHEIVELPENQTKDFNGAQCDVWYQSDLSPDFYGWVFPHGTTASIGVGTGQKGFSIRAATSLLRQRCGLNDAKMIRREGAPIPLRPLDCWDNGKDVLLAGDAAGVVAPASGEGIYYAMLGGRLAADAALAFLRTGQARELKSARKRFMAAHGKVFWVLRVLEYFWYCSDKRREGFVKMCRDPDVQRLTWEGYLHKKLVRGNPMAHLRVFYKDTLQLLGLAHQA